MNWVSIERDRCKECGFCVSVCLPRCIVKKNGRIEAFANKNNCSLCGHCVAVCPTNAVIHHKMNMEAFIDLDDQGGIARRDFVNFLERRRSHRDFMEKEIPLEIMEALFNTCRLAPTGSNVQNVEILVLQNRQKIEKLIDLTVDYYRKVIPQVEKRVEKLNMEGKPIPLDLKWTLKRRGGLKNLVEKREAGRDPIFHRAPAILIFHSTPYTSVPKDNCVIAAHTLALTAMTMGLETCYIGLFEGAFRNYRPVAKALNLPAGHEVFSVLVLGYPKFKFLRTVERKPLKVKRVR
jgi:nitroreductase/Pyruvate/2-oxoacid:ferredoxin oxidoreductase delta subunit